jgi:hypothetical protein
VPEVKQRAYTGGWCSVLASELSAFLSSRINHQCKALSLLPAPVLLQCLSWLTS